MGEKAMASDVLLTTADVAQILRLSVKTVGDMIRSGDLPAMRIGGVWRVRRESLEEWMRKQEQARSTKQGSARLETRVRVNPTAFS
jgi:excisionase family DNA binding protein